MNLNDMLGEILLHVWQIGEPYLALFVALIVCGIVFAAPMPGRSPRGPKDPWRQFKYAARQQVFERAGGRCEAPLLLAWGRCREAATEADHFYPWSKGGPTIVRNGQALCRSHNRSKGSVTPPWWKLTSLERRRRTYFPPGADARISARMSDADRAARAKRAAR